MRLVAGLEEPTAGQVLFDGRDVTGLGVQDRDLGFVFQVGGGRWRRWGRWGRWGGVGSMPGAYACCVQ